MGVPGLCDGDLPSGTMNNSIGVPYDAHHPTPSDLDTDVTLRAQGVRPCEEVGEPFGEEGGRGGARPVPRYR